MIDTQTQELEFATEVGFRVVRRMTDDGPEYQYQKLNAKGRTVAVQPTQQHAYDLWLRWFRTAQQLAAALEGNGLAGGGGLGEPDKRPAPPRCLERQGTWN